MSTTILIADPNINTAKKLDAFLRTHGFSCTLTIDATSTLKKAFNEPIDLIVLDVGLPDMNGLEVLKKLHTPQSPPVILLTGHQEALIPWVGFKLGAEDCIHKPCHLDDVLNRIKAVLRRAKTKTMAYDALHYHNIHMDCVKRVVTLSEKPLILTNTEFNILEILLRAPEQAFSKDELTEYALKRKHTAFDRSIDVHISNLRTKLGQNNVCGTWIKTIRGFGYALIDTQES